MIKSPDQRNLEWEVLKAAAEQACNDSDYEEAKRLALSALEEAEWFDEPDNRLWHSIELVAHVYCQRKEYAEAAAVLSRLLRTYVRYLGLNHSSVSMTMEKLADVYRQSGRIDVAERLSNVRMTLMNSADVYTALP